MSRCQLFHQLAGTSGCRVWPQPEEDLQQEPPTLFPGSASQPGSQTMPGVKLWLCPQRRGTLVPAWCRNEWDTGTRVWRGAALPQETAGRRRYLLSSSVLLPTKSPPKAHVLHTCLFCLRSDGLGEGCSCFSKTVSYRSLKLWNCIQLEKIKSFLTCTYQATCETMHFTTPKLEYNSNCFQIYRTYFSGYFHISSQNQGFF